MPISPDEALVLTPENVAQADELCHYLDDWLMRNLARADVMTRIPLNGQLPLRKVLAEVSRRYRAAGWTGAWYERNGKGIVFILWSPVRRKPS